MSDNSPGCLFPVMIHAVAMLSRRRSQDELDDHDDNRLASLESCIGRIDNPQCCRIEKQNSIALGIGESMLFDTIMSQEYVASYVFVRTHDAMDISKWSSRIAAIYPCLP